MKICKIIFFFVVLLFSANYVNSQVLSSCVNGSNYVYIFKITDKQAEDNYNRNSLTYEQLETLDIPVDSFPVDTEYSKNLPVGYYVFVSFIDNFLEVKSVTVSDLEIEILNNQKDLMLEIHDKQGNRVTDADVYIKNKKILFDELTQTYRLENTNKDGILKIEYNNAITLYKIEEDGTKFFEHLRQNQFYNIVYLCVRFVIYIPVQIIKSPYTLTKNLYKRIFKHGYYNWRRYSIFRRIYHSFEGFILFYYSSVEEYIDEHNKDFSFIITNKPMYLPGDTLKYKMYLYKYSGKPYEKPIKVELGNNYGTICVDTLESYNSGCYEGEFVLGKDKNIKLDTDLQISAYSFLRPFHSKAYTSVKYEEYELKMINCAFRSEKQNFRRSEQIAFYAEATDENDLNLYDAEITVNVVVTDVKETYAPQVTVLSTLWTSSPLLDKVGETKIVLPDSIFPQADLDLKIIASFNTSDYETKTITQNFSYSYEPLDVQLAIIDSSLSVTASMANQNMNVKGFLYGLSPTSDTILKQQIETPFQISINPYISKYLFKNEVNESVLLLSSDNSELEFFTIRKNDTVQFFSKNPLQIPFRYTIYKKNKEIERGYTTNLNKIIEETTLKNYFLSIQYIFGGKVIEKNYTIRKKDKNLIINVQQPTTISPGQTTDIEVTVTDNQGNPMPDTDITAWAITKKFPHYSMPSIPDFQKRYPERTFFHSFESISKREISQKITFQSPDKWNNIAEIDTLEFYKFLFPQNRIYTTTVPVSDSITQFAPYVIEKGVPKQVHIIFVDNRPVYFSETDNTLIYSFPISEGIHQIILRTDNKVITLDSMYFCKNVKTIFSIDPSEEFATNKNVSTLKVDFKLSSEESSLISKYLISVHPPSNIDEIAIIQDSQHLEYYSKNSTSYNSSDLLFGPFTSDSLLYLEHNGIAKNVYFESGYNYFITKDLIKMKCIPTKTFYLYGTSPQLNFNDEILQFQDVYESWKNRNYQIRRTTDYQDQSQTIFSETEIHIEILDNDISSKICDILLYNTKTQKIDKIFGGATRVMHNLESEKYKLIFLLNDDRYFESDTFLVQEKGELYLKIQPDSIFENSFEMKKIQSTIETLSIMLLKTRDNTLKNQFYNKAISFLNDSIAQNMSFENLMRSLNYNERFFTSWDTITRSQSDLRVRGAVYCPIYDISNELQGVLAGISIRSSINFSSPPSVETSEGNSAITETDEFYNWLLSLGITIPNYKPDYRPLIIVNDMVITEGFNEIFSISINELLNINVMAYSLTYRPNLMYLQKQNYDYTVEINTVESFEISGIPTSVFFLEVEPEIPASQLVSSLRSNFSDYAFWQPQLRTNNDGKASFSVTFPDDVTNWRTFFVAINPDGNTGSFESNIQSYKSIMARLSLPNFLVVGDSTRVLGKALNYTADSITATTTFQVNGNTLLSETNSFQNSQISELNLSPQTTDTLNIQYKLMCENGYFDGEELSLNVYQRGVSESNGIFAALHKDTSFVLNYEATSNPLYISFEATPINIIRNEIQHLHFYEYLCNEQAASKLIAYLCEKKIAEALGENFRYNNDVKQLIKRLKEKQNLSGAWGWWQNTDDEVWISLHVVEALTFAKEEGYDVNFLDLNKLSRRYVADIERENQLSTEKVMTLQRVKAPVDYKRYIELLETRNLVQTPTDLLNITYLKLVNNMTCSLDTIFELQKQTMFGNSYWGDNNNYMYDNTIEQTLLVYKILQLKGGYDEVLQSIIGYLFEKRKNGFWLNTYQSAQIMATILPQMLNSQNKITPIKIQLEGAVNQLIDSFPCTLTVNPNEALRITKTGSGSAYFSAFQTTWNSQPEAVSKGFSVTSCFKNNNNTVSFLTAGEAVTLKVTVEVEKNARYVMIEVPIPAGCSYEEKRQYYYPEVHREHFPNKVNIFCSQLNIGKYEFEIKLMPRFTGNYNLNPAKAEMMYFPIFYGRTDLKNVKIVE